MLKTIDFISCDACNHQTSDDNGALIEDNEVVFDMGAGAAAEVVADEMGFKADAVVVVVVAGVTVGCFAAVFATMIGFA